MIVELEFLDERDDRPTRLHDEKYIYDSTPPIPDVGADVGFEGYIWVVTKRVMMYFRPSLIGQGKWNPENVQAKVSIWCDGPFEVLTREPVSREEWIRRDNEAKYGKAPKE